MVENKGTGKEELTGKKGKSPLDIEVFENDTKKCKSEDLPYHHMVLESISDAFFTLDNEFRFVHFNNKAEELLGKKRKNVLGKHIFDEAFPEAKGSIFEKNYNKAFEKKEGSSFEFFFEKEPYRDWYDVKVYPLKDGLAVFFNITTEHKEKEEELMAANQQLRANELHLKAANQQLTATEKQLRAANQQLSANEQQLRASNQQLRASEQELKASNQQQSAMNQQLRSNEQQLKASNQQLEALNQELSANEASLAKANERFDLAMDASNDGLFDWNLVTNEIYYSPGWKRMLGYEDDELPNDFSVWEDLTNPDDVKRSWEMQQELIKGERDRFEMEFRMKHRDGYWVDILSRADAVFDENGKAVRIVGTHVDISEMKSILKEIEEHQRETEAMLSSMINAFVLFESVFDDDGNFISYRFKYINEAYERITGVKNEEVKGKTVHEVWPETELEWIKRYGEVAVTGKPQSFELYHNPTGKDYYCNVYRPYDSKDRFCVIFDDITERKRNERIIIENERKFRSYVEHAPYGIFIADSNGEYVDVNPGAERITGYSRDELVGMKLINLIFEDDREQASKNFQTLTTKKKLVSLEVRYVRKDGSVRHWVVTATPLSEGKYLGFTKDITERKEAETRILELQEKLKLAMTASDEGLWEWNLKTNEIFFDEVALGMLDYDKRDVKGKKEVGDWWIDQIHPDDREYVHGEFQDFIRGRTESYNVDFRLKKKDGDWMWVSSTAAIKTRDQSGEPELVIGIHRNISEKKMAEESLKESETKVRNIIENSTNMFYTHSTDHILTFVSPQCREILGYEPEEIMRKWTELATDHPLNEKALEYTMKAIETGERQPTYELQLLRKDGKKIWVEVRESPRVVDGKVIEIIGSLNDITDRKKAEDELKNKNRELNALNQQLMASEEQMKKTNVKLARMNVELKESQRLLAEIGKMAKVGGWELDVDTNKVKWSEETYRIHEVPLDQEPPLKEAIDFFHPDDRKILREALRRAIEEGEPYDLELRFTSAKGNELMIKIMGQPVIKDGKVIKLQGTFQDITKIKMVEMEMQNAKEEVEFYMDLLGHDLGNIHQGISGSLQMLQQKIDSDKINMKILELASESVKNATTLTKEVVLLSRLRDREPELEDLHLKEVLEDAIEQIRATFSERDIDIEMEDLDHEIRAEPLVRELFINILHNATRLQDDEAWIRMYATRKKDRVMVSIEDKGPGIPNSMKSDLFKRFGLKGEKIRRGLGLSISKVLAERYGGNIRVEDRIKGDYSKGARFLIQLNSS